MKGEGKTGQLANPDEQDASSELAEMRQRIADMQGRLRLLEAAETERKRAEEALRRRAAELEALQATVLDITTLHDLPTLLQTIVERAVRLLNGSGGRMYLCDPDQSQVRCIVSHNTPYDYTGMELKYGEGAAGTVAQTGEPLIIDDYRAWSRRTVVYEGEQPFTAILCAPMIWQGQVIGVIDILDDVGNRRFTRADLELLTLFANHASIATRNAQLHERAQARSRYLETLQQINVTLRSTLSLDEVLEAITRGAGEALDYAGSLIVVPDARGERLTLGGVWGGRFIGAAVRFTGLEVESFSLPLAAEENPMTQAYLTGTLQNWSGEPERIVAGVEPTISPRLAPIIARAMGAELAACVPLPVGEKVVGVLVVFSSREQLPDEERAILLGLADQAGLAIQNAQLYQAAQRELAERTRAEQLLRAFNQAALAMGKVLTHEEIFAAVAEEFKKLGFSCMVLPADESQSRLFTRYMSYEARALKAAEKLAGFKQKDFSFPVENVDLYRDVVWERKTVFTGDVEDVMQQVIPWPIKRLVGQLVRILKVPRAIAAPLIVGEKVIGVLSVQSDDLIEDDIPAVTAFAHQMAAAWRKAELIQDLESSLTERVRAAEALRESEARFRNIVESTPMGMHMYQLEPEGRLLFIGANPAADKILSVDNSQFVGKTIEEAFPPLAETEVPERYRQAASTGQSWQTSQITYQDNQIVGAFEVYAFQTSPGKMTAMFLDITERKRTEAEVLRLQHLLQNITDSMPAALIALNPKGEVLLWNPAAEALTCQNAEQVQGRSLWQVCPELVSYQDLFERVLNEGQVMHRHKESATTEAGRIYRDVSVFPLEADGIEGAVLHIDDVTRRVQLEEMMLQSAKMASVGRLAAGVAHEINNPLGAMMQSAQMLQLDLDTQRPRARERLQECGVDPEALGRYLQARGVSEYLEGIRTTGGRAAKIVADLLSFSRKSSSKIAPRDLNGLVEQTLDLAATDYDLKRKYDFRDIEIVRELAPDLPKVVCDGQQIQQVVFNLVRNAAQAMAGKKERVGRDSDGEYRPRLVVRTSQQEGWVRLEVEDNGPGIPEALRARLFEPFFTTKDVGEGTGLGLWLCWSIIVERHGGRIWAESVLDGGNCFVVELPTV